MSEILSRTVFETCRADQTEAPWEEEVRMLLAHDAALRSALAAAERERDGWHAEAEAWQKTATNLQERLDQFEAYAITVSSALADRAYVEALGNDLALTRGAMAADDARLRAAAIRVWGDDYHGCDTPEWLADEVIWLRQRLAVLDEPGRSLVSERAARESWEREFNVANAERIRLHNEAENFSERLGQFEAAGFPNVATVLDRIEAERAAREKAERKEGKG